MRLTRVSEWTLLIAGLAVCVPASAAQDVPSACPAPTSLTTAQGPDIFTPSQESDLGDIIADQLLQHTVAIEDDALTAELNSVAQKLLAKLPPTTMRFRVFLIDMPITNSFSLPGGRIYVTRRMVAFLRTEDELGGLLAHEMGHILTHQGGILITHLLQEVLGVNSVTSKNDIFKDYNSLLEATARPGDLPSLARQEEPQQYQADRVALQLTASAGYSPQSFVEFLDRLAETRGKTGSWVSDMFGMTKPNEKRMQLLGKDIATLPPGCQTIAAHFASQQFQDWRAAVIAYSGLGRKESIHGLVAKKTLDPPLRSDLTNLRFSPDGRYVLAQDESGIYVLSRTPFAVLFRIEVPDALSVQFTPDSSAIVFNTNDLRVEEWSIADQTRSGVYDVATPENCRLTSLAPDGNTLACFDSRDSLDLFDVKTSALVFQRRMPLDLEGFVAPFLVDELRTLGIELPLLVHLSFSPNGHYLLAARRDYEYAIDVAARTVVPIRGALAGNLRNGIAFLAEDRILCINTQDRTKSKVVEFPSGKTLAQVSLGEQGLAGVTRGNYAVLTPIQDRAVGVLDVAQNKIVLASDVAPLDIFDDVFVNARPDGSVGLYDVITRKNIARTMLPRSALGKLEVAAASPDLKWLAISERSRGGVWNLEKGDRVDYVRGFQGAYFDGDDSVIAKFPKFKETAPGVARMHLKESKTEALFSLDQSPYQQAGRVLLEFKWGDKSVTPNHVTLAVNDIRTMSPLWNTTFQNGAVSFSYNSGTDALVSRWLASADAAKQILNSEPALKSQASAPGEKPVYLLEIRDLETGAVRGRVLVGSAKSAFLIKRDYAQGDWLAIIDNENRTSVYSVSTGKRIGILFGSQSTISSSASKIAIEKEAGHLEVYDLPSFQKVSDQIFSNPISFMAFSADGTRLLVLTTDQNVYLLDPSAAVPNVAAVY